MKKILLVNPIYQNITPRSIRTNNLVHRLKKYYKVHLLYFDLGKEIKLENQVELHKIEFVDYASSKVIKDRSKNYLYRIVYKLYRINSFIKDPFLCDINNLKDEIIELDVRYNFYKIIVSISPYSLYKLAFNNNLAKKIVFDIGDPFYNNEGMSYNTKKEKIKKFEGKALKNAQGLIVTNEATKNYFNIIYSLKGTNIAVIQQGIDERIFDNITYSESNDKSKVKFFYAGRFYPKLRDPTALFKAIEIFNAKNAKKVEIEIYGGQGISYTSFNSRYINFFDTVNQKELLMRNSKADFNLFIDNENALQTPGKIYELLALGKPILFIKQNEESEAFQLVKNCKGIYFSMNNMSDISDTLNTIAKDLHPLKCDFDIKKYYWNNLIKSYVKFLERL